MVKDCKIGIISDEVFWLLDKFIDWAQKNEVKNCELRTVNGQYIQELSPSMAKQSALLLRKAGITVNALAAGLGKCDLANSEQVDKHLKMVPRLVENARIFGTNKIRLFAGWRCRDIPGTWDGIVAFCGRVLAELPDDMMFLVENEAATGCASLSDVAVLCLSLKNDVRIASLFDPGNYVYDTGTMNVLFRMGYGINDLIEAELKKYSRLIKIVHCKNATGGSLMTSRTARTVGLGDGEIDYRRLLKKLESLEVIAPLDLEPHRLEAGQQLSERTRATPGGEGYGSPVNAEHDLNVIRSILTA